jgi:hypothetical protein
MRRLRHVTAVTLWLTALVVTSVTVIAFHDFVLAEPPEWLLGGAEAWDLLYELSLALLASYVFYLVVVFLKRRKDQENLRPLLTATTKRIVLHAEQIIEDFKEQSGHSFPNGYPGASDTAAMCKAIKPQDKSPALQGLGTTSVYIDWSQYLAYWMSRTKKEITKVYAVTPFLDTDYLRLVQAIDDCAYFGLLENYATFMTAGSSDLEWMSQLIHEYFESVRQLKDHGEAKLGISTWAKTRKG